MNRGELDTKLIEEGILHALKRLSPRKEWPASLGAIMMNVKQYTGLELHDQELRFAIYELRIRGKLGPLCSGDRGYYLAANRAEAEAYARSLEEREGHFRRLREAIEKWIADEASQGELWNDEDLPRKPGVLYDY
jgi:hypothetical protein